MKTFEVKGTSITDVWHQAVYKCVDEGRDFVIDRGSYAGQRRKEFDYLTLHFTHPWVEPLLPKLAEGSPYPDPVDADWFYGRISEDQKSYTEYLMSPDHATKEGYTYGNRLTWASIGYEKARFPHLLDKEVHVASADFYQNPQCVSLHDGHAFMNQIEWIIYCYKTYGERNNQMVLQVAQPSDLTLVHPPCLRHIDTRIQDGALHFFPVFRSWDLWGGMPANIAAIELLKQYMSACIGVDDGEIIASSKGVHLYDDVWKIAEGLRA